MQASLRVLQHQPMIRFLGKRTLPTNINHAPKPHPAAPASRLPDSFATYRQKAQQHGPLNTSATNTGIGAQTGASLGPVELHPSGMAFARSELPKKFQTVPWTLAEIEAIESGGASMVA
ncbi:hypothetical protein EJ06DRAFT_538505 [Trichodelitschia bisporula]|uniref:Ribosomal protein S36, mitochondrial n=1 Tax=Trichodelitschia bisporula TaxID=703511 RepID=A0A6G1HT38_9PEZI|nr:hypothetical protein EJ06DRAFT_538505 [Trichodelitschia bisporula]